MSRFVLLWIALWGGGLLAAPLSASAESSSTCGPFVVSAASAAAASEYAAGANDGTRAAPVATNTVRDFGSIVSLEAPTGTGSAATDPKAPSEAILALPKNAAGQIPDDFKLGAGVSVRESFFSPVICATVARVAGPPGASIDQLVTVVPEGSALVANDVYESAAAAVIPATAGSEKNQDVDRPDPYASLQYGLAISGVREARGLSTGEGVTIALLDSAPESGHKDLSSDQIRQIMDDEPVPIGVHGTLMAGVINAIEDNGFGIAGLAPGAALVPIPICRPTGSAGGQCTIYDLLKGLDQAWEAESSIVNLSLSGPPNILLERGVARLEELGAVVVAAAGNEGTNQRRYPAAYPSVVGVGAVDRAGEIFALSNRGPWVEMMAPGVDVLSTVPGNAFAFGNGTSLAAAHVSGLIAVVASVTGDAKIARGELFRAMGVRSGGRLRTVPPVCEIFERIDRPCLAPSLTPLSD